MSGEASDRIAHLADLLGLSARSVRWLAQMRSRPADAARLRAIAADLDRIAGRLRQESRVSEIRVH